ncbi:MAG: DUF1610 domain-containing protein [Desulfurococcales archaeon]|jgi:hypothetical protein|nr:DUF1610 domain-containing protein [Desulfurococcales archaeon]
MAYVASKGVSLTEPVTVKKCSSCNRLLMPKEKAVVFKCPNCGKVEIIRCNKCRKMSVPYVCPICGFQGP